MLYMLPQNDVRQAAEHRLWQKHRYEQFAAADGDSDEDNWGSWTDSDSSTAWKKLRESESSGSKGSKDADNQQWWHDADKWADQGWHDADKWADKSRWHDNNKWADNTGWHDDNKCADKTWWHDDSKWADKKGWHDDSKWADKKGWHDDNKWADKQWGHADDSKCAYTTGWHDDNKDAADNTQGWHDADSKWADNTGWHDDKDAADSTRCWGTWNNPSKYPGALLMGDPEKPLLQPVAKGMPQPNRTPRDEPPPALLPTPPNGPPPASVRSDPTKPVLKPVAKVTPQANRTHRDEPPPLVPTPPNEPPPAGSAHAVVDSFDEPIIDAILDELRARGVDDNGFDETTRNEANRAYNEMIGKKCSRGTRRRAGRKDQRKRTVAALAGSDSESHHDNRLVNRRSVRDIVDSL